MKQKQNKTLLIGLIAIAVVVVVVIAGAVSKIGKSFYEKYNNRSVEELMTNIDVSKAAPIKGSVVMGQNSLYDELPEIDKYPLAVTGTGEVNIEIFASGEKAGSGYESWLIDMANAFNNAGNKVGTKSASVSVRPISSGQGGDYVISGKHVPELYCPSNELFGNYVMGSGGKVKLYQEKFLSNTAGILIKKGLKYKSIREVADAVAEGKLNLGYTNPQTSATGLNLLMTLLTEYDAKDPTGEKAKAAFTEFQKNIPYVAYTTMQMRDSASNGSLDAMVMEYQTYTNESSLKNEYDFIPFGARHDSPLYISTAISAEKKAVADAFYQYCMGKEGQDQATEKGFNNNPDYRSDAEYTGAQITQALKLYKASKDAGRDIAAVFVADCSGSMDGDPIRQLKNSLTNGIQYINENNYVGLVSYSSSVSVDVPIEKFDLNQKAYFQGAVDHMVASGGTCSYEAITVAMDMVKKAMKEHPQAKPMIFLLSDGYANGTFSLDTVTYAIKMEKIPIYTIGYTSEADMESLKAISNLNEAASISADSEDIVYKIKSLFNSSL